MLSISSETSVNPGYFFPIQDPLSTSVMCKNFPQVLHAEHTQKIDISFSTPTLFFQEIQLSTAKS